uniref:SDR family oxidoreductase n=1 Tax=Stappia sp. TaxID=1870903 RepID=UPI003BAD5F4A
MAKAVVLGGYGLIGSACMRALEAAGFSVTGVGRSHATASRLAPDADWIIADITRLDGQAWREVLRDAEVVVNAAGALQDGGRDDLVAIHERAVATLVDAMERSPSPPRLVQISAAGVRDDAPTDFFRTKARGDAIVRASPIDWVILRPTLVIAPAAYGGTALLRAAATLPFVLPRVLADAPVQTVFVDDLAAAVVKAAKRDIPAKTVADITEARSRSFLDTLKMTRRWLGHPPARVEMPVPAPLLRLCCGVADLAGRLGWRSPLRSNAVRALEDGISGDPSAWTSAGGNACRPLEATFKALPATVQERWYARLYLLFPLMIVLLSLFWTASGVIGFLQLETARDILTDRGMDTALARAAVIAGSLADIVLGLAVLWRPGVRAACLGMIAVSLAYLAGGTLFAPDLWADPLGPLVKVLPAAGLALVTLSLADDR